MIPPCDPAILENNPQFKRLYQQLTTQILNPDGSTRANDVQPARKAVLEELRACQLRNAKKQIKKRILRQLAFEPDSTLPDDCRHPVAIVTLYLESSPNQLGLSNEYHDKTNVLSLLAPDIDTFYAKLPMIIPSFTNSLSLAVQDLQILSNAGGSTNFAASGPPEVRRSHTRTLSQTKSVPRSSVSSRLNDRLRILRNAQFSELPASRTLMATKAAEVLAMRAAVLEQTVTLLERTKHGALARATKAKAEHLATVASGVGAKLNVMKLDLSAVIHTPEATAALKRYHKHLGDVQERLEEKRAHALETLKAYEDVDLASGRGLTESGPIMEIARRYGALIRDIEEVNMEIQRLRS